jgi:hypothetical protein
MGRNPSQYGTYGLRSRAHALGGYARSDRRINFCNLAGVQTAHLLRVSFTSVLRLRCPYLAAR